MAALVTTEVLRMAIANGAVGVQDANATLDTARVILLKGQIAPSPTTVLDDLEEASFSGYERSGLITWDTPLLTPGSGVSVEGDTKEFVCNATANETIYGAALVGNLTNDAGPASEVFGVEMFDTPVPISRSGQGVRYFPHFEYP